MEPDGTITAASLMNIGPVDDDSGHEFGLVQRLVADTRHGIMVWRPELHIENLSAAVPGSPENLQCDTLRGVS
jgi:hypothetical protein